MARAFAGYPPGVFVWPVVAGHPRLGALHAGIDVVPHEVVGVLGGVPLHEDRAFAVSGGHNLPRCRGDTYKEFMI